LVVSRSDRDAAQEQKQEDSREASGLVTHRQIPPREIKPVSANVQVLLLAAERDAFRAEAHEPDLR
jgi:hypothetical protein